MDIRQRNMGMNAGEIGQSWDQTFNSPMAPPNAAPIMNAGSPQMPAAAPPMSPPMMGGPTRVSGVPMGVQPGAPVQPHPGIMPIMRGGMYGR